MLNVGVLTLFAADAVVGLAAPSVHNLTIFRIVPVTLSFFLEIVIVWANKFWNMFQN